MKIHQQSEFVVFANPNVSEDNSEISYDGYATFVEDDTEFIYSLVNGTSYQVTKSKSASTEEYQCLSAEALPFGSILPALNDAVLIPSASIAGENIEFTNLLKTSFSGVDFVICASGATGFTGYSSDMTIKVEYLDSPISVPAPNKEDVLCDTVAKPTIMSATAIALLTGDAISSSSSRNLKAAERMAIEAESCECKSTPRPCIFFHGAGNKNQMDEPQDTPQNTSGKIGDMNDHAPCCSMIKYAMLNTMDNAWTDDALQQKYCDFAL
ncbi:unnamed protein product [Phytophthora lilii]|uniref:Unnamed protein product n=1 Tax=Phytophthora lilii TaxID=2077276 RepID=A0A9W6TV06_9STRA|nr:unnamed protein product [Phytophthora lilii]